MMPNKDTSKASIAMTIEKISYVVTSAILRYVNFHQSRYLYKQRASSLPLERGLTAYRFLVVRSYFTTVWNKTQDAIAGI